MAKQGSNASASKLLHLTTPAIGAQIRTLGDLVDVSLLKQTGGQLTLAVTEKITVEYAQSIPMLRKELENILLVMNDINAILLKVGLADIRPKLIV